MNLPHATSPNILVQMWFGVMEWQWAVLKGGRWFPDVWGALTFTRNTIKAGSYGFFRVPFLPFDPAVPSSPATDYGAKLAIWGEDSRVQMGPVEEHSLHRHPYDCITAINLRQGGSQFPLWYVQQASPFLRGSSSKNEISPICFIVLRRGCERNSHSLHVSHTITLSGHAFFSSPHFPEITR